MRLQQLWHLSQAAMAQIDDASNAPRLKKGFSVNKSELIEALGLSPHFEGGYFKQTFRADHRQTYSTPRGPRVSMTSIQYVLTDDSPLDCFHTKHSDGIQYYQLGAPITYHLIEPEGAYSRVVLGPDLAAGHQLQLAVTGGTWKAAELEAGEFGMISEVVAPGWEMDDMILATYSELVALFPQHEALLRRLASK
jgi:predicted cupin superfamily sugar epimerase